MPTRREAARRGRLVGAAREPPPQATSIEPCASGRQCTGWVELASGGGSRAAPTTAPTTTPEYPTTPSQPEALCYTYSRSRPGDRWLTLEESPNTIGQQAG